MQVVSIAKGFSRLTEQVFTELSGKELGLFKGAGAVAGRPRI